MILWNLLDQSWQDQSAKFSQSKHIFGQPQLCFLYSDFVVPPPPTRLVQKKEKIVEFREEEENRSTWNYRETTYQGAEHKHWEEQLAVFLSSKDGGITRTLPDMVPVTPMKSLSTQNTPLFCCRRRAFCQALPQLFKWMDRILRARDLLCVCGITGEEESCALRLIFVSQLAIQSSWRLGMGSCVLLWLWYRVLTTPAPTELLQLLLYILYLLRQFTKRAIWRII